MNAVICERRLQITHYELDKGMSTNGVLFSEAHLDRGAELSRNVIVTIGPLPRLAPEKRMSFVDNP